MTAQRISAPPRDAVRQIVDLARRAPSVHNTQPWSWRPLDDGLELWADRSRQLVVSDPAGRNLVLSCGAALHHTLLVARALGWAAVVDHLPDARNTDLLARVTLRRAGHPDEAPAWLRAIDERRTDRRRFTSWPVPESRLQRLVDSAEHHGAEVIVVADEPERHKLDLLVSRAMYTQRHDARVQEEEQAWLDRSAEDGLPDPAALPWGDGHVQRYPTRFDHEPPPEQRTPDRNPVERTDGILVIATPADGPRSWLHAGEALSAIWLTATMEGLSVVPLSQVIEVDETRVALDHELLKDHLHGQLLVRVGWQEIGRSDLPRTPRRPLEDVLAGT
jgi:nitroreductase